MAFVARSARVWGVQNRCLGVSVSCLFVLFGPGTPKNFCICMDSAMYMATSVHYLLCHVLVHYGKSTSVKSPFFLTRAVACRPARITASRRVEDASARASTRKRVPMERTGGERHSVKYEKRRCSSLFSRASPSGVR